MMRFLDYDPVAFLRCHSASKNDNADVRTQVWHCAFEPVFDTDSVSTNVATCGGNSVCIIDCKTGSVVSKFYVNVGHLLFALSWGMVCINRRPRNVLITGGARCTLYILDPTDNKYLLIHTLNATKKTNAIHAIICHPKERNIFFCGLSDGDIRSFSLMSDDKNHYIMDIANFSSRSEVFDLSFCIVTSSLLASCNGGLFLFHYPTNESIKSPEGPRAVKLDLPKNSNATSPWVENKLVDSVEVLSNGLFCCKCALHGKIYLFDLKPVMNQFGITKLKSIELKPVKTLVWSTTDNYFMYMGVSPDSKLLCCGDDKGNLWMYDLADLDEKTDSHIELNASTIIPWPKLSDHFNDKKRKLSLQTYDIIVDKVALTHSGQYLVAVTSNNLVCIWSKIIS